MDSSTFRTPDPVPDLPSPIAWRFYVAYCWSSFVIHAAWIAFLFLFLQNQRGLMEQWWELGPSELDFPVRILCYYLIGSAAAFGLGAVFVLRLKRSPKAWNGHLVNLIIGASTFVLAPIAVPTIFLWFRDDTRRWFGRA
ncbi:MAG: hypothetical protein KF812_09320 [Fimbriimonadaceae bacterium]|nr:hypothetical protein [Fimbriimonadaceae bacterium]